MIGTAISTPSTPPASANMAASDKQLRDDTRAVRAGGDTNGDLASPGDGATEQAIRRRWRTRAAAGIQRGGEQEQQR